MAASEVVAPSTTERLPAERKAPPPLYRPELDALRFFAFLSVFVFHGVNVTANSRVGHVAVLGTIENLVQSGTKFGLCLFFFLSAYLISALLNIERERTGTVALKSFYTRRALRIWPLYFSYILLVCLLHKASPAFAVTGPEIALMLLFAGNWFFVRHGFTGSAIEHLWSISVEEQFYLIFPVLVRLLPGNQLRRVSVGICILSLLATGTLAASGVPASSIWADSLSVALFFAGGSLLSTYTASPLRRQKKSRRRALLAVSCGLFLWLIAGAMFQQSWSAGVGRGLLTMGSYGVVVVSCALILWGFLHLPLSVLPRPLIYLGKISYGLYVFHALALYLARVLVAHYVRFPGASLLAAMLMTIAAAALSYQLLERPFLRLKRRFEVMPAHVL